MEYNECKVCGANGGRAGMLISSESIGIKDACRNCFDTKEKREVVVHLNLNRTTEEINKTINILK